MRVTTAASAARSCPGKKNASDLGSLPQPHQQWPVGWGLSMAAIIRRTKTQDAERRIGSWAPSAAHSQTATLRHHFAGGQPMARLPFAERSSIPEDLLYVWDRNANAEGIPANIFRTLANNPPLWRSYLRLGNG